MLYLSQSQCQHLTPFIHHNTTLHTLKGIQIQKIKIKKDSHSTPLNTNLQTIIDYNLLHFITITMPTLNSFYPYYNTLTLHTKEEHNKLL